MAWCSPRMGSIAARVISHSCSRCGGFAMKPSTTGSCAWTASRPRASGRGSAGRPSTMLRSAAVTRSARHVFVVDPSAGRDDAKRPTSPPVHPPHGFELIAHDFRGVGLTTRDPLRPILPGDARQRVVQHRIVVLRNPYRVRLPVPVLHVTGQVQVGQHRGAQSAAEEPVCSRSDVAESGGVSGRMPAGRAVRAVPAVASLGPTFAMRCGDPPIVLERTTGYDRPVLNPQDRRSCCSCRVDLPRVLVSGGYPRTLAVGLDAQVPDPEASSVTAAGPCPLSRPATKVAAWLVNPDST